MEKNEEIMRKIEENVQNIDNCDNGWFESFFYI
jgi:hypothetical protein